MIKYKSLSPRINQLHSHNKGEKPDLQPAQVPIPPLKSWLLNAAQGAITGSQPTLSPGVPLRYVNSATAAFQAFLKSSLEPRSPMLIEVVLNPVSCTPPD